MPWVEEVVMTFLVQFRRLRRGVPEVIRTMHLTTVDSAAALAYAQNLVGTRRWPVRTDALRVMDDGGRTLIDWTVPAATAQPSGHSLVAVPTALTHAEPRPAPPIAAERHSLKPPRFETGRHLFAVGQSVSYAEDGRPDIWEGGYEIVRLDAPLDEPQYAIRSADQSYDRIVHELELREDLGARMRGR
jgi:hypothetical protein